MGKRKKEIDLVTAYADTEVYAAKGWKVGSLAVVVGWAYDTFGGRDFARAYPARITEEMIEHNDRYDFSCPYRWGYEGWNPEDEDDFDEDEFVEVDWSAMDRWSQRYCDEVLFEENGKVRKANDLLDEDGILK